MLECWALTDTPNPEPSLEVGLIAQSPDEILTYQDQATNMQRSGLYARGVGIALATQLAVLAKAFPHFADEFGQPDAVGFGIEDAQAKIVIRSLRPLPDEPDPCASQGVL